MLTTTLVCMMASGIAILALNYQKENDKEGKGPKQFKFRCRKADMYDVLGEKAWDGYRYVGQEKDGEDVVLLMEM